MQGNQQLIATKCRISKNRQEGGSGGPLCCGAGVRAESPGAGDMDRVEVTQMIIFSLFHKFRRQNEQSKTGPSRVFCWMNLSCFLPKPDKFGPLLSFLEHLGYSLP